MVVIALIVFSYKIDAESAGEFLSIHGRKVQIQALIENVDVFFQPFGEVRLILPDFPK